jgi:plasmid stabilization system protein ParE
LFSLRLKLTWPEAFGRYERRRPGLGHDVLDAIDRVFRRIADRPLLAACVWREAPRATKAVPHAVLYVARGESVYILAVLHQPRDPRQSQGRIGAFRAPG